MYIVTSKPKRMSEYSGLVHIVITFYKLFVLITDLLLGTHGSQFTLVNNIMLEEKSCRHSGFSLALNYASNKPLRIAKRANSAELETSNFCLILV